MEKLKDIALAYFDKAILALCAALLGWQLLGALQTQGYKRVPEDFNKATQAARKNLDATAGIPEGQLKEFDAVDVAAVAKQVYGPIAAEDVRDYHHTQTWQRPFDLGINFRTRPKLLAPKKPVLQQNRGLMDTFVIDEKGERQTRKVPKSRVRLIPKTDPRFEKAARELAKGGRGMKGMRPGMHDDPGMTGGMAGNYGGEGDMPGMSGGMPGMGGYRPGMHDDPGMNGGEFGMSDGRSRGYGSALMGRGSEGFDPNSMMGGDGGPGGPSDGAAATEPDFVEAKKPAAGLDADGKKKKEELVDEPITARQGFRWVEVCADFEHSKQIVEYVEALKEGLGTVPLHYAYLEVQRSTLGSNGTWSEFAPIDAKRMFDIVNNARQFQPERSAALVQGLSMGLPALTSVQRQFLHKQLETYTSPKPASYPERLFNPLMWDQLQDQRKKQAATRNPDAPEDEKKADDGKKEKQLTLEERNVGRLGGEPGDAAKGLDGAKGMGNRARLQTALARFWDFTVEPGATYRYRMRTRVYNPNYKRKDVYDSEIARLPVLPGEWSEPSDPVTVDPDAFWYVAEAPVSKTLPALPSQLLEVQRWNTAMGRWLVQTFAQRPGQVVGVVNQAKKLDLVVWNNDLQDHELKAKPLGEEFNAGTVLLVAEGGNRHRQSFEALGRRFTVTAAPRVALAIDTEHRFQRRQDLADADNEARAAINASYQKLAEQINAKKAEAEPPAEPEPPKRKAGKNRGAMESR